MESDSDLGGHFGVIDESALECWLAGSRGSEAVPSRELDVPVCMGLIKVLLDVVDGALFVVGTDGAVVVTNARARALLASREDVLPFIRTGTMLPPLPSSVSEIATWSNDTFRAWRRWFPAVGGAYHALVVVESLNTALDLLVGAAVKAWVLTTRQRDVFRHVLEGQTNKEIATRLKMSSRTVEVHVTALFEKAGVDSRARLVARAWELGRLGGFSRE